MIVTKYLSRSVRSFAQLGQIIMAKTVLLRKWVIDKLSVENVGGDRVEVTDTRNVNRLNTTRNGTMSMVSEESTQREDSRTPPYKYTVGCNDLILYALGVGASVANPEELRFLYENHEDFNALPSFYVQPGVNALFESEIIKTAVPGHVLTIDQLLHGEQYLEVFADLPLEGNVYSKAEVVEVLDKGLGACIVNNIETFDGSGQLIASNQVVIFAVDAGKFGGPRHATKIVACADKPNRKPDHSLSTSTSVDQAALYRLLGDTNPLHIDPGTARRAGVDKPILHGLCLVGYSVRLILSAYAGYDSSLFKAVKVRFTKPVTPGQTLRVNMWLEDRRVHFETVIQETNTVVISGAYVDLKSVVSMRLSTVDGDSVHGSRSSSARC